MRSEQDRFPRTLCHLMASFVQAYGTRLDDTAKLDAGYLGILGNVK
jgi:hypothetical protein